MTDVLLIEDDPTTQRMLCDLLVHLGYAVHATTTGREGLELAARRRPDVVLLDLGLPDIPGVEVIRRLRTWSEAPIVVVSGSRQVRRKADALDAGADDFIDKPFDVGELRARLRAAERRAGRTQSPAARRRFDDLDVDYTHQRIHRAGEELVLTETEWLLFEALTRDPGRVLTHHWLARQVWGEHAGAHLQRTMRSHLRALRAKLADDARSPRFIRTEVGVGYRWICAPAPGPVTAVDTDELRSRALGLRGIAESWASGREQVPGDEDVVALVDKVIDALGPQDPQADPAPPAE